MELLQELLEGRQTTVIPGIPDKSAAPVQSVVMTSRQREIIVKGLYSRFKRLGLSEEDGAAKIGISPMSLYRLKTASQGTSPVVIKKIAEFLKNTK